MRHGTWSGYRGPRKNRGRRPTKAERAELAKQFPSRFGLDPDPDPEPVGQLGLFDQADQVPPDDDPS